MILMKTGPLFIPDSAQFTHEIPQISTDTATLKGIFQE